MAFVFAGKFISVDELFTYIGQKHSAENVKSYIKYMK